VVQLVETFKAGGTPTFVDELDAVTVGEQAGMPLAPVMIYGDDVSHVVTEEGVAYLYKAGSLAERREAIAAVAGATPIGLRHDPRVTERLRRDGLVALPEDLRVDVRRADRSLLAAKSIGDLEAWSGGLYDPPARFRNF
jgi:malonate decarboxylase alpha subunit